MNASPKEKFQYINNHKFKIHKKQWLLQPFEVKFILTSFLDVLFLVEMKIKHMNVFEPHIKKT